MQSLKGHNFFVILENGGDFSLYMHINLLLIDFTDFTLVCQEIIV